MKQLQDYIVTNINNVVELLTSETNYTAHIIHSTLHIDIWMLSVSFLGQL